MRLLLAIIFSAALVWGQRVPAVCAPVAPGAAERPACSCGHCGKTCCCLNNSEPDSQPIPAVPAPQVSPSSHWLLLAPAAVVFALPQLAGYTPCPPAVDAARPISPPLYQQNCTFLI